MTEDARFEDGVAHPLNLGAQDAEDLQIISALLQDAVFPVTEMRWEPRRRRLSLLLNRVRWEDVEAAQRSGRAVERVRTLLVVDGVLAVASQGINRHDRETILSLLSVTFEPAEEPGGFVVLTLAGDGAVRAEVEALDLTLRDVTRPYAAPSGRLPRHPD